MNNCPWEKFSFTCYFFFFFFFVHLASSRCFTTLIHIVYKPAFLYLEERLSLSAGNNLDSYRTFFSTVAC